MSFTIGDTHWIPEGNNNGIKIEHLKTPKNDEKFSEGPDTIVIHYTADGRGNIAAKFLNLPSIEASAHIVIEPKGEKIYQLVPFDTQAWHAGRSKFKGRKTFNNFSIGIEIDNAGLLVQEGGEFVTHYGKIIPSVEVKEAIHRNRSTPNFWHAYHPRQIEVCKQLCKALIERYNITSILGHEEISPKRKTDPGPLFPLDALRKELLEEELKPNGKITASWLNIRSKPNASSDKVARPLVAGTKVKIIQEDAGWYFIETPLRGWVRKSFVNTEEE